MQVTHRSGLTILALILSLLVIALTASIVIAYLSGQGGGASGVESPIKRARNVECLAQVKKVEMHVQIHSVQNGRYPGSLDMVDDLSEADLRCPVTQKDYQYDPQSGRVSCPDHLR